MTPRIRLIIIIVIVLVVLFLLWRNWPKIKRLFQRDYGDYSQPSYQSNSYLENLAERLYKAIYNIGRGFTTDERLDLLQEALLLNDTDLKYLSKYYFSAITQSNSSLYTDVDDEILPGTDLDEQLLARLSKLGER